MITNLIEKILNRYGFLGALAVVLSSVILFLIWAAVCVQYPIAIIIPFLITSWMVWKVTGGKDE